MPCCLGMSTRLHRSSPETYRKLVAFLRRVMFRHSLRMKLGDKSIINLPEITHKVAHGSPRQCHKDSRRAGFCVPCFCVKQDGYHMNLALRLSLSSVVSGETFVLFPFPRGERTGVSSCYSILAEAVVSVLLLWCRISSHQFLRVACRKAVLVILVDRTDILRVYATPTSATARLPFGTLGTSLSSARAGSPSSGVLYSSSCSRTQPPASVCPWPGSHTGGEADPDRGRTRVV